LALNKNKKRISKKTINPEGSKDKKQDKPPSLLETSHLAGLYLDTIGLNGPLGHHRLDAVLVLSFFSRPLSQFATSSLFHQYTASIGRTKNVRTKNKNNPNEGKLLIPETDRIRKPRQAPRVT
jgi:hypothetical protein